MNERMNQKYLVQRPALCTGSTVTINTRVVQTVKINVQQGQTFHYYHHPLTRTKHQWSMSLYIWPSWQVARGGPVRQKEFMSIVTQQFQQSDPDL